MISKTLPPYDYLFHKDRISVHGSVAVFQYVVVVYLHMLLFYHIGRVDKEPGTVLAPHLYVTNKKKQER